MKRILIVRTDRIGDLLLTVPLVSALRDCYPACEVDMLVSAYAAPLLQLHDHIHEVLVYHGNAEHAGLRGCMQLAKRLREKSYDAAILAHPRPELALALRLAGIPLRTGTAYRWYSFLLNDRVKQHRARGGRHEAEFNLDLARLLLGDTNSVPRFDFDWTKAKAAWREVVPTEFASGFFVIHPGCGGSAPNLSPARYRMLAERILARTDWALLLSGSPAEAPLTTEVAKGLPADRVHTMAGRLDLVQLAGMLADARLLLAGSTGPLHLAAAAQTPVLSWFCPAPSRAADRWGPYGQRDWVLQPDVEPCSRWQECPHGNCLDQLSDRQLLDQLDHRLTQLLA